MNIRDLKYLVAIADHGHFGRAAEASFVSQPALSMQIKKLEQTLGVKLIERTNKRLFFTDVGTLIVQQARDIISRTEMLRELAKKASDPMTGDLRLGIIPTLGPYILPHIIPRLSVLYPKLHFYLTEDTTANLVHMLEQGKLDAALLALPIEGNHFEAEVLFDEPFFLAVSKKDKLANEKSLKHADLKNKTLMLLEEGHCLRDQALLVCHAAHAFESTNFRATSLETLRYMVAAGVGMTLMPKLACRTNDGVAYLSFPKDSLMKRTIGMVWRGSSAKKLAIEEVSAYIKTVF